MEVNISDLTLDQFIYPRGAKSQQTISAYVEALAIGAQFPPIKIQRVFNYPSSPPFSKGGKGGFSDQTMEATIILDGIHRWSAFKEKGIKEIAAVEWKDKPIDYEKNKVALLLESAQCNTSHGDRLSSNDKKRIGRDIASTDPECKCTEDTLAEKLGVSQQTVNAWITDIRARQKTNRNSIIIKLSRLGWTQEKISEKVGLSRNRASEIVGNTSFSEIDTLLSQGHDMEYIARHYHMDLALAWALRLEGKTDQEKFKELGWGLRPWDQWNFNGCLPREIPKDSKVYPVELLREEHPKGFNWGAFHRGDERFGDDWPGRIPAQLIAHTLFYFTKPGDLVLDPMAGGGVVTDVCLLFERKCQAFDLASRDKRPEIEYHHWDPQNRTWPVTKKPDLIFFDPPYYIKKEKEYEEKANKSAPSISSYTKEDYERFLKISSCWPIKTQNQQPAWPS